MRLFLLLLAISLTGCAGPTKELSLVGVYSPTSKDGTSLELMAGGFTSLAEVRVDLEGPLWFAAANWREERTKDGSRLVVFYWGGDEKVMTYSVIMRDGLPTLVRKSGSLTTPFGDGIKYASSYRKRA